MPVDAIHFMSAMDLAAEIRAKRISPVETVSAVLERMERLNPALNAVCVSMAESAMQAAKQAESDVLAGREVGPLHGVPITVKDLIDVAGERTTWGSKLFEKHVAKADAPVVERVRRAGAIIVGKTNSSEFGWKAVTDNRVFGTTRNPWDQRMTPGGSSGGAGAAVAAGIGPIALGSDGGGSIRIPASFCGLVGYKASFGRVPNNPPAPSDSLLHTGPLTRTVADASLTLNVIAGLDERDRNSLPKMDVDYLRELDGGIEGRRIAYSPDLGYAQVHPEVARICAAACQRFAESGAQVEAVDLGWRDPFKAWATVFYGGIATTLGNELEKRGDMIDPGLRKPVEKGLTLTAVDFVTAELHRARFWNRVQASFANFDFLVTPTVALPPFPVNQDMPDPIPGHEKWTTSWTPFTYPFNLTGHPAVTVPCGWYEPPESPSYRLPIGLQIVGRRFDDVGVLRAARAFEQIQPWSQYWPPEPDVC